MLNPQSLPDLAPDVVDAASGMRNGVKLCLTAHRADLRFRCRFESHLMPLGRSPGTRAPAYCLFSLPDSFPRPVDGPTGTLLPVHTPGTWISRPKRINNTCQNQATGALFFLSAQRHFIWDYNPGSTTSDILLSTYNWETLRADEGFIFVVIGLLRNQLVAEAALVELRDRAASLCLAVGDAIGRSCAPPQGGLGSESAPDPALARAVGGRLFRSG